LIIPPKNVQNLTNSIQSALRLISYTADIWSSKGLHPFLALTAHWLSNRGEGDQMKMRQTLLAFRRIRGAHSGQRIAQIVFNILEHAELLSKVM
jgi:hypothetical protein